MVKREEVRLEEVKALVSSQLRRKSPSPADPQNVRETEEVIEVRKFITEPATVSVDYALTINLGNYESARIGVALTVPCYREEIDQAHVFAKEWAEARVKAEQKEIRKAIRETEDF